MRRGLCLVLPLCLVLWGISAHFHWCRGAVSLRSYLAVRCGWFRAPSSGQIESELKRSIASKDLRLGLIILDMYSQTAEDPELRAMASFLAGCCAQELGDTSDALALWSRTMARLPSTRGGLWSRRATEWLLSARERRWVV